MQNLQNQIAGSSADEYSAQKYYYTKDYVSHENIIYKCIQYCSPASWEVNKNSFVEVTLLNALTHGNLQFIPHLQNRINDFNYLYGGGAIFYQIGNTAQFQNHPQHAGAYGIMLSVRVSGYVTQIYFGVIKIVHRYSTDEGVTWSAWLNGD